MRADVADLERSDVAEPEKRIVVDGVDFAGILQFPRILSSATAAMQPPRLVVALLMVAVLIAFGRTWDSMTEPTVPPAGLLAAAETPETRAALNDEVRSTLQTQGIVAPWPAGAAVDVPAALTLLDRAYRERREGLVGDEAAQVRRAYLDARSTVAAAAPRGTYEATSAAMIAALHDTVRGVIYVRPQLILQAGTTMFMRVPVALWNGYPVFTVAFAFVVLIVVAIGGGALSRMAVCDLAGQERLRVRDAFDFALGNWVKLMITPALPLLMTGVLAVVLLAFGLLLAPWIDVIGGILYGIALLVGFVLAFLLLGYAVGFPLLLPAVAAENCDAADTHQRAYAYVLNRPLHYLG
jgi:hypothetical protein